MLSERLSEFAKTVILNINNIQMQSILAIAPVFAIVSVLAFIVFKYQQEWKVKNFFTVGNSKTVPFVELVDWFNQFPLTKGVLNFLGVKYAMFNDRTLLVNKGYASISIIVFFVVALFSSVSSMMNGYVWYLTGLNLLVIFMIFTLVLYGVFSISRLNVIQNLPDVFKSLTRALETSVNMTQAIDEVITEIKGPMVREFKRLSNALKHNDRAEVEAAFDLIRNNYNSNQINIMLRQIHYVYENGNAEDVVEGFHYLSTELEDKNQRLKTLALKARSMMIAILSISICGVFGAKEFVVRTNFDNAIEYVNSQQTMLFQVAVILVALVCIAAISVSVTVTE